MRIYSLLFLLFLGLNQIGQINFQSIEQSVSVDSIIKFEAQRNSILISKTLLKDDQNIKQLVFSIKEENVLPLIIQYNYNLKNELNNVLYLWNSSFLHGFSLEKTNLSTQMTIIEKYNTIIDEITLKYGIGIQNGELNDLKKINEIFGLYRSDTWDTDKIKINSFVQLCNYYRENITDTIYPINKIEVSFEYKKSENKTINVEKFNINFNSFISFLNSKDYVNAKNYFSSKINRSINENYLKNLRDNINTKKELIVYKTSTQKMADGSENQILQYKYTKDTNEDPLVFISVVFESDGKILGINPVRLGE